MANKFKQIFCEHIWKRLKREQLDAYQVSWRGVAFQDVKTWVLEYRCVKCGKIRFEEYKEIESLKFGS